ncbi:hypothetical protein K2Y11_13730 [bacterium]|nr:hypothetical protein [bacterium]
MLKLIGAEESCHVQGRPARNVPCFVFPTVVSIAAMYAARGLAHLNRGIA